MGSVKSIAPMQSILLLQLTGVHSHRRCEI